MNKENIANIVSEWTHSGTMLAKEPEEIKNFIDSGMYVVVYDQDDQMVGFGAQTFNWSGGWKELGAVVVDPKKRGEGYGHQIVQKLIQKAIQSGNGKFFALCNAGSLPIFLQYGAKIIEDPKVLPDDVWKECLNCPKFIEAKLSGKLCCDTPVAVK